MTHAQRRMVEIIRAKDGIAEYWDVINDWVKDAGPTASLAFRNQNRTVEVLVRDGIVTIDDDGLMHLTERA